MSNATPPSKRRQLEETFAEGTELSWALRSVLLGYDAVNDAVARRLGVGTNDVAAIGHLMERPELGAAELAEIIGITTASATVLLDRLETAGHITRSPHPTDRRRKTLHVTEHATAAMFEVLQPLFDALMSIDNDYSDHERHTIASYLHRVSEAYEQFVGVDTGPLPPQDPSSTSH